MRTQLVTLAILVSAARSYADDVTCQRPVKPVASFVDAAPLAHAELRPDRRAVADDPRGGGQQRRLTTAPAAGSPGGR